MRRFLVKDVIRCGSGHFTEGKVYEIIKDEIEVITEDDYSYYSYDESTADMKQNNLRWITLIDDSKIEDVFEVEEHKGIIFETDREYINYLLDNVNGLDNAIINLAKVMTR